MEIHQLQYVVAVAKHKHFTHAAEELNVGQSSLSQQIAKLETEFGIKIFDRSSRTVSPTPAGKEFIEYAREILTKLETAKQCISSYAGLLKGTVNIGTITTLTNIDFGKMIVSFHNKYPGLTLNIIQEGSIKLIELLQAGEIDIAFVTLPPMKYNDLDFFHLGKDEYVLVTSANHRFAKRKIIDLAEARNENFIFHKKTQSMYSICMQACNKSGFKPRILCYSSGAAISLDMIRADLGIGFFPSQDMKYFRISGLVSIKLREPPIKHVVMATKKKPKTPSVNTFYQHIIEWVQGLNDKDHNRTTDSMSAKSRQKRKTGRTNTFR
jgi:LysR family hydrogen peroxide-inducible transcriptional activator